MNTNRGFQEIFFKKIIDRILTAHNTTTYKYTSTFETTSAYNAYEPKSSTARSQTAYTGTMPCAYLNVECFGYYSALGGQLQACYNDTGIFKKFEALATGTTFTGNSLCTGTFGSVDAVEVCTATRTTSAIKTLASTATALIGMAYLI